jgi:pimeloyl-ACP methyl ester carboxylesterase
MRRRVLVALVLIVSACASTTKGASDTSAIPPNTTAPAVTVASTTTPPTTLTTTEAPATTAAAPTTVVAALNLTKFKIVSEADLYVPPTQLPAGKPGDIVQVTTPARRPDGSTVLKVLYLSTTAGGKPTAVSGLVYLPTSTRPDAPILAYAHGTTGLDDRCAPSKQSSNAEPDQATAQFLSAGYIVTATDYEGLGTPGVHPYVVGRSEGPSILDSIRAARILTGTTGKSVVWGHSQGGGATLWAAELAPTYAPDAQVVGVAAGAPAVELKLLSAALRTSPFFGYIFMAGAGFKAAYPDLDESQVYTAAGLEAVDFASKNCFETVAQFQGKPPEDYIKADPASVEPFATYLEDNTPGNLATTVPIFIYHGDKDEQIPVVGTLLMFNRACKTGGFTIQRQTYPDQTHVSVIAKAMPDITSYLADRLAGKPAPTTPCPTA